MLILMWAAAAAAAGGSTLSTAEAAAKFGAREAISDVGISPDGDKVSVITPLKGLGSAVLVADLTQDAALKPVTTSSGDPERLTGCTWLTNDKLACHVIGYVDTGGSRMGFTRYVTVDAKGGGAKLLSNRTSDRALGPLQNGGSIVDWSGSRDDGTQVLMTRTYTGEVTTGTHVADDRRGMGVDAVDVTTLRRSTVESPRPLAVEYISDGHGTVRIMGTGSETAGGYDSGRIAYSYRTPGSRDWRPLGTLIYGERTIGFNPLAVDHAGNAVYGLESIDGHRALVRIALDGTLKREIVLQRQDVDVDGVIQVGRQQRVIGATYATDRRSVDYFDPAMAKLRASLEKAMPGKQVGIVDASADESRLVLSIGSDVDPGRYYVFTKATRKLEELLPVRPQLKDVTLSPVRSISYRAADGTMIPAYLTLPPGGDGKNLPAIVMPHGGPASRDEWGFDWLSQFFANRGFAVIQPQYRGSSGYGDAWFQKNGFQSWRTAIGDVDDAGRYLVQAGIAAPDKLAIFGWSYGGYAALQSGVTEPGLFKAIVAVAPVTDLETLRSESRYFSNYALVDRFIGTGEHVRSGSPAQNVRAITAPVLMFHGSVDNNVGVGESRMMASRLQGAGKKVDYVEFKGLDHYLIDAEARAQMLSRADAFLRETLKL
jgi:dipeptidyl aminopeptidase/acylaminoacyl peptidase